MAFIDVHCHIERYGDKVGGVVKRAKATGVKIILNNGANLETNLQTIELAEKFPEIKIALGFHPTETMMMTAEEVNAEIDIIRKYRGRITAIGEVGLDFSSDGIDKEKQRVNFQKLIDLSLETKIPLIVHSRKAEKEVVEMLEGNKAKKVVMHCFSGSMKLVKRIIENKWYLSIPASIKYNAHFQKLVEITPIENLLCETDSPFLHPDRKKNNEPALVAEAYKKIAEIKKLKLDKVEKVIEGNYRRLFISE